MNSEKVKEIRIALCQKCDLSYIINGQLKVVVNEDILNLINELESENERLRNTDIGELIKENENMAKQCVEWSELNFKKRNKIKQLKDQIAELEGEITKLNIINSKLEMDIEFLNKQNTNLEIDRDYYQEQFNEQEDFYVEWNKQQLKQFVEMLKKISCEAYLKEQLHRCIDETLKKFINKELQNERVQEINT